MMKAKELRQICSADERTYAVKQHKHKCSKKSCGTVWKHANSLPGNCSSKQFEKAHSCPKCGEPEVYDKFRTTADKQDETESFFDSLLSAEEL
jgi:hypothetical protein